MVETCNERAVEHPADCDLHTDCERCKPWTESFFDVRRVDTGEVFKSDVAWIEDRGMAPGAMWWAEMSHGYEPKGRSDWDDKNEAELVALHQLAEQHPDYFPLGLLESGLPVRQPSFLFYEGPQLCVMTPGGRWVVTSRASNCGLPYDYEHRCWVVHGDPPAVNVDKNGKTCAAGGGSISCGKFHGFLTNGVLV